MITMHNIGDKKQAIFESTLALIRDHGFHGAPMSLVAKNAGVAAGTIYHYFESKEALLKAVIEQDSPVQSLRSLPADAASQPIEVFLSLLLGQMLEIAESEAFLKLLRVFLPELLHNPNFSPLGMATSTGDQSIETS